MAVRDLRESILRSLKSDQVGTVCLAVPGIVGNRSFHPLFIPFLACDLVPSELWRRVQVEHMLSASVGAEPLALGVGRSEPGSTGSFGRAKTGRKIQERKLTT